MRSISFQTPKFDEFADGSFAGDSYMKRNKDVSKYTYFGNVFYVMQKQVKPSGLYLTSVRIVPLRDGFCAHKAHEALDTISLLPYMRPPLRHWAPEEFTMADFLPTITASSARVCIDSAVTGAFHLSIKFDAATQYKFDGRRSDLDHLSELFVGTTCQKSSAVRIYSDQDVDITDLVDTTRKLGMLSVVKPDLRKATPFEQPPLEIFETVVGDTYRVAYHLGGAIIMVDQTPDGDYLLTQMRLTFPRDGHCAARAAEVLLTGDIRVSFLEPLPHWQPEQFVLEDLYKLDTEYDAAVMIDIDTPNSYHCDVVYNFYTKVSLSGTAVDMSWLYTTLPAISFGQLRPLTVHLRTKGLCHPDMKRKLGMLAGLPADLTSISTTFIDIPYPAVALVYRCAGVKIVVMQAKNGPYYETRVTITPPRDGYCAHRFIEATLTGSLQPYFMSPKVTWTREEHTLGFLRQQQVFYDATALVDREEPLHLSLDFMCLTKRALHGHIADMSAIALWFSKNKVVPTIVDIRHHDGDEVRFSDQTILGMDVAHRLTMSEQQVSPMLNLVKFDVNGTTIVVQQDKRKAHHAKWRTQITIVPPMDGYCGDRYVEMLRDLSLEPYFTTAATWKQYAYTMRDLCAIGVPETMTIHYDKVNGAHVSPQLVVYESRLMGKDKADLWHIMSLFKNELIKARTPPVFCTAGNEPRSADDMKAHPDAGLPVGANKNPQLRAVLHQYLKYYMASFLEKHPAYCELYKRKPKSLVYWFNIATKTHDDQLRADVLEAVLLANKQIMTSRHMQIPEVDIALADNIKNLMRCVVDQVRFSPCYNLEMPKEDFDPNVNFAITSPGFKAGSVKTFNTKRGPVDFTINSIEMSKNFTVAHGVFNGNVATLYVPEYDGQCVASVAQRLHCKLHLKSNDTYVLDDLLSFDINTGHILVVISTPSKTLKHVAYMVTYTGLSKQQPRLSRYMERLLNDATFGASKDKDFKIQAAKKHSQRRRDDLMADKGYSKDPVEAELKYMAPNKGVCYYPISLKTMVPLERQGMVLLSNPEEVDGRKILTCVRDTICRLVASYDVQATRILGAATHDKYPADLYERTAKYIKNTYGVEVDVTKQEQIHGMVHALNNSRFRDCKLDGITCATVVKKKDGEDNEVVVTGGVSRADVFIDSLAVSAHMFGWTIPFVAQPNTQLMAVGIAAYAMNSVTDAMLIDCMVEEFESDDEKKSIHSAEYVPKRPTQKTSRSTNSNNDGKRDKYSTRQTAKLEIKGAKANFEINTIVSTANERDYSSTGLSNNTYFKPLSTFEFVGSKMTNFNAAFKFSPETFELLMERHPQIAEYISQPEVKKTLSVVPYIHDWTRNVTDELTFQAIAAVKSPMLFECAAKWHKNLNPICQNEAIEIYVANRPKLFSIDHKYHADHNLKKDTERAIKTFNAKAAEHNRAPKNLTTQLDTEVLSDDTKYKFIDGVAAEALFSDTFYYKGVPEAAIRFLQQGGVCAHVIFMVYTSEPGRYNYFSNCGEFEIVEKEKTINVESRSRLNSIPYKHEICDWDLENSSNQVKVVKMEGKIYELNMTEVSTAWVANDARMVYIKMHMHENKSAVASKTHSGPSFEQNTPVLAEFKKQLMSNIGASDATKSIDRAEASAIYSRVKAKHGSTLSFPRRDAFMVKKIMADVEEHAQNITKTLAPFSKNVADKVRMFYTENPMLFSASLCAALLLTLPSPETLSSFADETIKQAVSVIANSKHVPPMVAALAQSLVKVSANIAVTVGLVLSTFKLPILLALGAVIVVKSTQNEAIRRVYSDWSQKYKEMCNGMYVHCRKYAQQMSDYCDSFVNTIATIASRVQSGFEVALAWGKGLVHYSMPVDVEARIKVVRDNQLEPDVPVLGVGALVSPMATITLLSLMTIPLTLFATFDFMCLAAATLADFLSELCKHTRIALKKVVHAIANPAQTISLLRDAVTTKLRQTTTTMVKTAVSATLTGIYSGVQDGVATIISTVFRSTTVVAQNLCGYKTTMQLAMDKAEQLSNGQCHRVEASTLWLRSDYNVVKSQTRNVAVATIIGAMCYPVFGLSFSLVAAAYAYYNAWAMLKEHVQRTNFYISKLSGAAIVSQNCQMGCQAHKALAQPVRLETAIRQDVFGLSILEAQLMPTADPTIELPHVKIEPKMYVYNEKILHFQNVDKYALEKVMREDMDQCKKTYYHTGLRLNFSDTAHTKATSVAAVVGALLDRQAGAFETPHQKCLRAFDQFSLELLKTLPLWHMQLKHITPQQFLATVPKTKRKLYALGLIMFEKDRGVRNNMTVFAKSEIEHGKANQRPRCICNPNNVLKFMSTYFNHVILESIKQIQEQMPWFHIGYNSEQTATLVNQHIANNKVTMFGSFDGSGHDAHQWSPLINSVDNRLVLKHFDEFFYNSGWDYDLYDVSKQALLRTDYLLDVPNRYDMHHPLIRMKMKHGVASGLAHRTTLGNTLRVYFYTQYVLHLSRQKADIYVAGDDVMLITNEHFSTESFQDAFWSVYSKPHQVAHGLGQVAKELKFSLSACDFLSKDFILSPTNRIVITRKPLRVLFGSNHAKTTQLTPYEHAGVIAFTLSLWAGTNPFAAAILEARRRVAWFEHLTKKMHEYLLEKRYQLMTMVSMPDDDEVEAVITMHYGSVFLNTLIALF